MSGTFWAILSSQSHYLFIQLFSADGLSLLSLKADIIYRPRIYLLGRPDCLRGFTKIGKTITPTVKRQIGATTINIDSKDINNFEFINR